MNVCIVGIENAAAKILFELLRQDGCDITLLVNNEAEKQTYQSKGARVIVANPEENGPWIESLPNELDYIINLHTTLPKGRVTLKMLENNIAPRMLHEGQNLVYIAQRKKVKRIFQLCNAFYYKSFGDAALSERSAYDAAPSNYGLLLSPLISYLQSQKNIPVTLCVTGHYVYDSHGVTEPLIPTLLSSAYAVCNSGENFIHLTHVEDLAGALRQCLVKEFSEPIINIADNKPITQRDFISLLSTIHKTMPVVPLPQAVASIFFGDAYAQSITTTRILKTDTLKNTGYWLKYPDYTSGFSTEQFRTNR